MSDVRCIAQLSLDPAKIPVKEHLLRFAQVLGRSAKVKALNPAESWRFLSAFEIYDTTEGQVIFNHVLPFVYERGPLENPDARSWASIAITICIEGELDLTYNRDFQVKATPGNVVLGLARAAMHIKLPVPSRYVVLYIAQPTMLTATSLTDSNPVIEAHIPETIWPIVLTLVQQLRTVLHSKEDGSLGPMLKSLEVLVDQLARQHYLRLSKVSDDRLMAIQAFVDENVRNPQLGVKLLCDRFHMSRATLYRQMQLLGGVKYYLQSRRLVCCYDELRRSPYQDVSFLKVLVRSYHFKSLKDFRQRYLKHFGVDPLDASLDQDTALTTPNPSDQIWITRAPDAGS